MSRRLDELARRREELIALCEDQRAGIAAHVGALATPVALADRAYRIVRYLRTQPLALRVAMMAVVVLRRRGLWKLGRQVVAQRGSLLKWGQRGFLAWRAWRAWRDRRVQA